MPCRARWAAAQGGAKGRGTRGQPPRSPAFGAFGCYRRSAVRNVVKIVEAVGYCTPADQKFNRAPRVTFRPSDAEPIRPKFAELIFVVGLANTG